MILPRTGTRDDGFALEIAAQPHSDGLGDVPTATAWTGDAIHLGDQVLGEHEVRAHVHAHTIAHGCAHGDDGTGDARGPTIRQ